MARLDRTAPSAVSLSIGRRGPCGGSFPRIVLALVLVLLVVIEIGLERRHAAVRL